MFREEVGMDLLTQPETCSRSGDQGRKGNSILPASALLWGQVVRTPDFFMSHHL